MTKDKHTIRYWALSSGGKDSILAMDLALEEGLKMDGILSFLAGKDSYLFHYPNVKWAPLQARSMNIPQRLIDGTGWRDLNQEKRGFKRVKKMLQKEGGGGLISGLIASNFQRRILKDLEVELFLPLWGIDQKEVLKLFLDKGYEGIITAVAAEGLDESFLGRKIDEELIKDLKTKRINPAGEGGEFETFVLDGPIFAKRLVIKRAKQVWEGDRGFLAIDEMDLS